MATSQISKSQFFTRNGKTQVWLTLANKQAIFRNVNIMQNNLDSELMRVNAPLTYLEGCTATYQIHEYKAGDAFVDDNGKVSEGQYAGFYDKAGSKVIKLVIDYTAAKAKSEGNVEIASAMAAVTAKAL